MKKIVLILSLALVLSLPLSGCLSGTSNANNPVEENSAGESDTGVTSLALNQDGENVTGADTQISQEDESDTDLTDNDDNIDPSSLPSELASTDDLNYDGGYLLIGEVPEEDIGVYCENVEVRDRVYIRYGTHIQSFQQEAWVDPTILPRVEWKDWDGDGKNELVIDYLRHEGEYFDGETTSPGIVGEQVVYRWDGDKWTDIHFTA